MPRGFRGLRSLSHDFVVPFPAVAALARSLVVTPADDDRSPITLATYDRRRTASSVVADICVESGPHPFGPALHLASWTVRSGRLAASAASASMVETLAVG
jgi:hypothetical protein